jgi:hypothetical protein
MKDLRSITAGALALASGLGAGPAAAVDPINFEVRDNADFVALCSALPTAPNYVAAIHFCHGFAVGFNRYHEALKEGKDFEPLYCLPANATRAALLTGYVAYSKAHPEYDKESVANVVTKFLVDTHPCPAAAGKAR